MKRLLQLLRPRSTRLRTLALVVLFVAGYAASFVHDVTVRHQLCAEHGEWEHGDRAASEPVPDSADAAPGWREAPEPAEADHAHCSIVLVTRGSWLPPEAGMRVAAPAPGAGHRDLAPAAVARELHLRSTPARGPPANA